MQHPIYYLALVPSILLAITFHEYAHARVALWFGDRTAYDQGRVTLNPLAHLDPMGTIMLFLVGFGWGKPVPVDHRNFRHPYANAVVSAAGPCTNFVLAVVGGLVFRLLAMSHLQDPQLLGAAAFLLMIFVQINLALGLFNLLPLYPLDGSHVFESLLPPSSANTVRMFNYRYGAAILLSLILLGYVTNVHVFALVLGPPLTFLRQLLLGI